MTIKTVLDEFRGGEFGEAGWRDARGLCPLQVATGAVDQFGDNGYLQISWEYGLSIEDAEILMRWADTGKWTLERIYHA